jgi:formamidopyrimidine-DNA glycosylase
MPELPEVETVVRQLAETIPGCQILDVEVIHADLLSEPPDSFRKGLRHSSIEAVSRRGKNILISLSGSQLLVVNLGMTGQLLFTPPGSGEEPADTAAEPSHPAIVFGLRPVASLVYADVRRFGSLRRFTLEDWRAESDRLGPEPLDPQLSPSALQERLGRSRSPIRSWLLDQTRIAGIGNIYASEALFRAGIHPKKPARSLHRQDSERLLKAVREVLSEAIRARGTTLRDYRTASGDRGTFGPALQAYGREGEPCLKCNTPIERIVFGNRSAYLCPRCQEIS